MACRVGEVGGSSWHLWCGVIALLFTHGCGGSTPARDAALTERTTGAATRQPAETPLPTAPPSERPVEQVTTPPIEAPAGACDWSRAGRWESPGDDSGQLIAVGCSLFVVGVAPLRAGPFLRRLDLDVGTWRAVRFRGARRQFLGLATDGERLVVAGGMTGMLRSTLEVAAYEVASDSWRSLPSLPRSAVPHPEATGLEGVALSLHEGRLYAFGGRWTTSVPRDRGDGTLDVSVGRATGAYVLELELGSEGWRALPPIPKPTAFTSAVWLDGQIWLVGGADDPLTSPVSEVFSFDPATEAWRSEPSMPRPSAGGAVVVDGRIHAFSSYVFDRGGPQIFDPKVGAWSTTRRLDRDQVGRLRGGPALVEGRIVIRAQGRLVEYRPATDTWHPLTGM